MRNLRLMFLAVLGFTLFACGGEATEGEIVGSVEQAADSCNCPAVIDPVCGVDGKTYDNACVAACEDMKVEHEGRCSETVEPGPRGDLAATTDGDSDDRNSDRCICPTVIDPVCGVDGKTYDNSCVAACWDVGVDYEGECKE